MCSTKMFIARKPDGLDGKLLILLLDLMHHGTEQAKSHIRNLNQNFYYKFSFFPGKKHIEQKIAISDQNFVFLLCTCAVDIALELVCCCFSGKKHIDW